MPFVVPLVAQKEFCNHKGLKIKQGPDLGFLKDLFKGLALFDVLAIFDHLQICWFSLGPPHMFKFGYHMVDMYTKARVPSLYIWFFGLATG
jgi:hypothetical protein